MFKCVCVCVSVCVCSRTNDDDLPPVVQPVHQGQQRRHDGRVDLVLLAAADGGQAVDLVEEDDAGLAPLGLLEQEAVCLTHTHRERENVCM